MSEATGKKAPRPRRSAKPRTPRTSANGVTYATMDDVAAEAGVHPTTVSMALRAHPSIPAATRERIVAAARRIGYVRDPLLDAFNFHRLTKLAAKQSPSIAFVVDANSSPYFFGSSYHPLVYEGVRAVAEAQHLSVEVFPLGTKDMTANRLNTIISSRGISGVLLSTFTPATQSIELDWDHYSAVKIESHHLLPQLDVVSNDQCQAARLCMRKLRELGYRRIGLATARDDESRLQDNFSSGVLVEQAELPDSECVPPLLFERTNIEDIAAKIVDWVRTYSVDAVMSNWHELLTTPPGETARITTTDLKVPEGVAFASLDVPAHWSHVGGIVQNHRLVGMRAMEQLGVLVKTYHRGAPENPSATYVPGFWRDGPTTPRKARHF
jgi:LacI family transcriptional regulator